MENVVQTVGPLCFIMCPQKYCIDGRLVVFENEGRVVAQLAQVL